MRGSNDSARWSSSSHVARELHCWPRLASRGALCLVGLFALAVAGGCGSDAAVQPAPPEVNVAEVISKRITDWDEYTGRLEAVDRVDVRPRA